MFEMFEMFEGFEGFEMFEMFEWFEEFEVPIAIGIEMLQKPICFIPIVWNLKPCKPETNPSPYTESISTTLYNSIFCHT